jgi:predicted ferric reductase
MNRTLIVSVLAIVAAMTGGMALRLNETGQAAWLITRASGLASFALLSASVVLGLLISSKATSTSTSRLVVFSTHQFLSVLSLAFLAVHTGALLFDGFFHFTVLDLVVPFVAPYSPVLVGLGVVCAWLAAGVTGSFWARQWIGQKAWRKLHFASFAAYVLALGHGIGAGTDSGELPVALLYSISATLVVSLLTYRIAKARARGVNSARSAEREPLRRAA